MRNEFVFAGVFAAVLISLFLFRFLSNRNAEDAKPKTIAIPKHTQEQPAAQKEVAKKEHTFQSFTDFKKSLAYAQANDKKVIAVFGADWCGWCRKFERDVLESDDIKTYLNEHNYILCHINVDNEVEKTYPKYIKNSTNIPAMIIVDKNGKLIKSRVGFMKAEDFTNWVD